MRDIALEMAENPGAGSEGLESRHQQQCGREEDAAKALGRQPDLGTLLPVARSKTPDSYTNFVGP